jgi:hypothetical protein
VLPLPDDRLQQLVVAGLDRDVDRAARQVQRAHRVPAERARLPQRQLVLVVRAAALAVGERRAPAPLDEPAGLLEVALLAGDAVELDERHLDLRMPAHALVAAVPERLAHVVGGAPRDLGQPVLPAGPQPRDRGLDEVAVAVELVPPLEVAVAMLAPAVAEARVQVPVLLLRARRLLGDLADHRVEPGVAAAAGLPRHRLDELVDVGVREFAAALAVRVAEVLDPAEPPLPAEAVRNDRFRVQPLALAPEAALELDFVDPQRLQRAAAGRHHELSHGGPPR